MTCASGFSDSLAPHIFGKQATISKRSKKLVATLSLCRHDHRMLSASDFYQEHVGRVEPLIFEANSHDIRPFERLVPICRQPFKHSYIDSLIVPFHDEQSIERPRAAL